MSERPDFKNILILGDSISDGFYDAEGLGWVGRLEKMLHADQPMGWGFQNFSLSGDRTPDVLHRLAGFLTRENTDYLFLAVGTNDIFRYVSPDAPISMDIHLRHRYWESIFRLAKPFVSKIFVFGLIPVNEDENGNHTDGLNVPIYSFNKDIVEYNRAIKKWAEQAGAVYIDFYDRFMQAGGHKLLQDDSHPNTEGHRLMAEWAYEDLKGKI